MKAQAAAALLALLLLGGCGDTGRTLSPSDPTQPGPFAVGVTRITFTRASTTTGEPRVLETVVWYPAAAGDGEDFFGGALDAPLAEGRFPFLVFSHGTCSVPTASSFLTSRLASHGFVVAAPPHPGSTAAEGIGTCFRGDVLIDSFINRPDDLELVMNELPMTAASPAGSFAEAIDTDRIGLFGHSFGGMDTIVETARNPRIRAALPLAPGIRPVVYPLAEQIRVPTVVMAGVLDSLVRFDDLTLLYDSLHPPRYFLKIENTGHFAFSDRCTTSAPRPDPDKPFDECVPGTLTQDEAHLIVLRYSIPFFLRYVADDHRFDAVLDTEPTPAGVELRSDLGS